MSHGVRHKKQTKMRESHAKCVRLGASGKIPIGMRERKHKTRHEKKNKKKTQDFFIFFFLFFFFFSFSCLLGPYMFCHNIR